MGSLFSSFCVTYVLYLNKGGEMHTLCFENMSDRLKCYGIAKKYVESLDFSVRLALQ